MLRKSVVSHEKLVDEARFILKNLQRSDVFGDRVKLSEAERVLEPALSFPFQDFVNFLAKYGYLRLDSDARLLSVTRGGATAAEAEDSEFHSRLARHFAHELSSTNGAARTQTNSSFGTSYGASIVPSRLSFAPERPVPDEVLDRRYRRGSPIGRGAIGVVYRGQHVSLGRAIALKEAQPVFQYASYLRRDEIVRRIRLAVEAHAQLEHPHIVQVLDQNSEREYPYFVMELAAGGNLRQRLGIAPDSQFELAVAIRVLTQLAYALRYAHKQGVLHRSLKPENVLFDHLGNVKLADFGMTQILDQPEGIGPMPILVGSNTVAYLAPERLQVSESSALDASADIYALGIISYEMLTGKLPGRRSPLPSQARTGVPEAFDEVFDRMTRDALTERYSDLDAVLDGLYQAFEQSVVAELGTMMTWAQDPGPTPQPEVIAAPYEVPEAVEEFDSYDDEEVEVIDKAFETDIVPSGHELLASQGVSIAEDLPLPLRSVARPPPPPPAEE